MHTFYVFLFRIYMFRLIWTIFRVPQSQNTLVLKCPIYKYLLVWSGIVFLFKMLKIFTFVKNLMWPVYPCACCSVQVRSLRPYREKHTQKCLTLLT